MGSWGSFGASAGVLLGSAVGAGLTAVLAPAAVQAWGWRVPFLLGLAVGLAGLAIRRHLPAARPHADAGATPHAPVVEAFRTAWRPMVHVAGFCVMQAVGFYMMFVYSATYLKQIVHVSAARALDINTLNMLLLLLFLPLAGALSDRLGRKPLLIATTLGTLVLAWPLFWLMHHPSVACMLTGQMGFAVLVGMSLGVSPAAMAEAFPARVRCSACSVSYNLTMGLIGGTTPMVATYLIARSHNDLSPALYLMGAAALSFLVILRMRETAQAPLR